MILSSNRFVGVRFGSTERTDRIGKMRLGAEGPSSSNGDVIAGEKEAVVVSSRRSTDSCGVSEPLTLGPHVLVLDEGRSCRLDVLWGRGEEGDGCFCCAEFEPLDPMVAQ